MSKVQEQIIAIVESFSKQALKGINFLLVPILTEMVSIEPETSFSQLNNPYFWCDFWVKFASHRENNYMRRTA